MSVYNGESYVRAAIESIQKQSFQDFEFLIVNDGSTDNSLSIIAEFARDDCRVKVLDKPNSGLTKSLNYGAAHATGDWIARIDADDIAHKDRFALQLETVGNNPAIKLLGTGHQLIDEKGELGACYSLPSDHDRLLKRLMLKQGFFSHSSALFAREIFEKLAGYRAFFKRAQDYDLWLRFVEHGEIACVPEALLYIRKHAEQISHSAKGSLQLVDSRIALYSHYHREAGLPDPVEELNTEAEFEVFRRSFTEELAGRRLFDILEFKSEIKDSLADRDPMLFSRLLGRVLLKDRDLFLRAASFFLRGETIVSTIFQDKVK